MSAPKFKRRLPETQYIAKTTKERMCTAFLIVFCVNPIKVNFCKDAGSVPPRSHIISASAAVELWQ